jgi:cell division protein FtsL
MKAQTMTANPAESISRVRLSTMVLGAVMMLLLFSIVYVRQMCIRAGYDISSMAQKIEQTEIDYTSLLAQKSDAYDAENLYKKAKEMGLTMPDVRRTYYVKD